MHHPARRRAQARGDGYLLWCAVNEPKNYMALLARILPYYVSPPEPTGKGILSYEETLARLRFMELDKDGKRVGTGIEGCDGYLLWCAVNRPEQYMALLARILPYYGSPPEPTGKGILTYEETLARLRERGLPLELIDHMRLVGSPMRPFIAAKDPTEYDKPVRIKIEAPEPMGSLP